MNLNIIYFFIKQLTTQFIFPIISFLFGIMYTNRKKGIENYKNLRLGVLSILRAEIIKEHFKCKKRGYCSVYSISLIEDIYNSYRKLGGNGAVTKLVNDLKNLPVKV